MIKLHTQVDSQSLTDLSSVLNVSATAERHVFPWRDEDRWMDIIRVRSSGGRQSILRVKKPNDRKSHSRTASRALDVLEYFGRVRQPLRAIEIARALDLHTSSTSQLLKTLVDSTHLIFDARTKTYLPGPRLIGFSAWMVDSYGIDERFSMLLSDVHSATGAVVTLTTPNDLFMQILEIVGHSLESNGQRGASISLFGSAAVGGAYLSILPESEVKRLSERARMAREEMPSLLQRVAKIRCDGLAEGETAGFRSLAMPLPQGTSPVPLVLALADEAPRVEADRAALEQSLREAVSRWIRPSRALATY